ncbi:hypothetical protein Tco_0355871 [Tanacetum coccineum]
MYHFPPREEVRETSCYATPLSSPLPHGHHHTLYSSPPTNQVSSPVPVLSPSPPASPIRPLGYRAAMIRLRAEAASTSHSLHFTTNIILPSRPDANLSSGNTTFASTLLLTVRVDRPEVTFSEEGDYAGSRERCCMIWDLRHWEYEMLVDMLGVPATDDTEMGRRMTKFTTRVRQDTNEIYTRDWHAHARTARLIEAEAKMSREAWGRSMDASDLARAEVMSLRTQVVAQQTAGGRRRLQRLLEAGPQITRNWRFGSEGEGYDLTVIPTFQDLALVVLGVASKPKTMQDAVEIATELMDKKIHTFVQRQTESKRKYEDTSRNTQNQQQQNKRQNTGRAYTARSGEKNPCGESKPLCAKCNYHHDGPCAPKCHKCNKVGHYCRDYEGV